MILGLPLTLQQLQTPPRPRHLHHQRFRTFNFCVVFSIESKDIEWVFKCIGHCNEPYQTRKPRQKNQIKQGERDWRQPTFFISTLICLTVFLDSQSSNAPPCKLSIDQLPGPFMYEFTPENSIHVCLLRINRLRSGVRMWRILAYRILWLRERL